MKPKIQEIIIVEGRDDISAVKAAVDAEIIQVNGFAIRKKGNIDKIKKAYENKGIILLTDPDYAGNEIRSFLQQHFPKAKNAYISRSEGKKGEDIGVENAKPEAILRALQLAKCNIEEGQNSFSMQFLYDLHLVGHPKSTKYRELFYFSIRNWLFQWKTVAVEIKPLWFFRARNFRSSSKNEGGI
ncbi:ribonuclease M5 [Fusobacterium necrophorum]|nr:ribonuclease M5 [Fusobacterium necrophorum]MDK4496596.1 ribonuclease M5 [Fusobacterium necrophorum]